MKLKKNKNNFKDYSKIIRDKSGSWTLDFHGLTA